MKRRRRRRSRRAPMERAVPSAAAEWVATLAVGLVAMYLLAVAVPGGWYAKSPAAAASWSAGQTQSQTAGIRVKAEEVRSPVARAWSIEVSELTSGRPVQGVQVVLTADHVEMPGVHPIGPIVLDPAGLPGTYHAEIGPLMYGTWDVTVTVAGSVEGSTRWREAVQPQGSS